MLLKCEKHNNYHHTSLLTSAKSPCYRYGFNGKEKDDEGLGGGGITYDYGFRIYNPGLGRFLSIDPLAKDFPWYTPYQFAGNKPIAAIDMDGLEEFIVVNYYYNNQLYYSFVNATKASQRAWDKPENGGGRINTGVYVHRVDVTDLSEITSFPVKPDDLQGTQGKFQGDFDASDVIQGSDAELKAASSLDNSPIDYFGEIRADEIKDQRTEQYGMVFDGSNTRYEIFQMKNFSIEFPENSGTLADVAQEYLTNSTFKTEVDIAVAFLQATGNTGKITGHTDATPTSYVSPIKNPDGTDRTGNQALSEDRASAIEQFLQQQASGNGNINTESSGVGSRDATAKSKLQGGTEADLKNDRKVTFKVQK